jgi:hypothetical protein
MRTAKQQRCGIAQELAPQTAGYFPFFELVGFTSRHVWDDRDVGGNGLPLVETAC